MKNTEILKTLMKCYTGGYFYANNCRINYSSINGWYCKDFLAGRMKTYQINLGEAMKKLNQ